MVVIPAWPVFMDWRALKTSALVLSRGAASKTQRAGVKQNAGTMLDLQIKGGGDERLRALAAGARHSAQERLTRDHFTGSRAIDGLPSEDRQLHRVALQHTAGVDIVQAEYNKKNNMW